MRRELSRHEPRKPWELKVRRVPCSCAVTLLRALFYNIEPLHLISLAHLYTQAWVAKRIATWRLRLQARRTRS